MNNTNKENLEAAVNKVVSKVKQLIKDHPTPLLVALDGRSGTGKSILAKLIAEKTHGGVVLSDDFYSGGNDDKWEGYTPQAKVDEVVDWKRMRTEVLEPLLAGKPAFWHPLDFKPKVGWVGWKAETVSMKPAEVIILDGAYSARPELSDIVNLAVLVESPDEMRRRRLLLREGVEFMEKWHKLWDPAEDYYFTKIRPRNSFDLVLQLG